jgi:hypothetical protein
MNMSASILDVHNVEWTAVQLGSEYTWSTGVGNPNLGILMAYGHNY